MPRKDRIKTAKSEKMAQGNCYLLIPALEKENAVPLKLKEKWQFKEPVIDPETGEVTGKIEIHPSWLKAANKLRSNFGDIREVSYAGVDYLLIEMELSFIDGEVAEVQKLQSNQVGKRAHYRILTNSEAKDFLAGIDIFQ